MNDHLPAGLHLPHDQILVHQHAQSCHTRSNAAGPQSTTTLSWLRGPCWSQNHLVLHITLLRTVGQYIPNLVTHHSAGLLLPWSLRGLYRRCLRLHLLRYSSTAFILIPISLVHLQFHWAAASVDTDSLLTSLAAICRRSPGLGLQAHGKTCRIYSSNPSDIVGRLPHWGRNACAAYIHIRS